MKTGHTMLLVGMLFPGVMGAQEVMPGATVVVEQVQSKSNTLTVKSRLVTLDVVVTDKKGNPVTDLTRDDFTVVEDKQPQRVRNFDPPAKHALPVGEVVHSTADLAKIGTAPVNILVLGEMNTPFEENAYSIHSVERFLKAQPAVMPPTELLAAGEKSFKVLKDFTQSLPELEAALKGNPVQYPWQLVRSGNGGPDTILRLARTLAVLEEIAQASAGTQGRKNIVWVGKGFASVDMSNLDGDASKKLQDAIKRCTEMLLSSRVTLYVVDPTPLSSATYDVETPTDLATLEAETLTAPFSNSARFATLAPVTGGRVFSARNDLDREIATSVKLGAEYYTLSYSPTNKSETPGAYRTVRIVLKRPDLVATTRDGYFESGVVEPTSKEDVKASEEKREKEEVNDVASAALSKMVYNGLKVRAAEFAKGRYSVAVADSSLAWEPVESGELVANVEVAVVCFSKKEKVLSHVTLTKSFARKDAAIGESQEIFTVPLDVPVGAGRLRVVVRDTRSGHLGTADVVVP